MAKEQEPVEEKEEVANEVAQELSKVASNPTKSIAILVAIAGIFIYLIVTLFFGSDNSKEKGEEAKIPTNLTKPVQVSTDTDVPSIPTLPSPPKLEDPTPPLPPTPDNRPDIEVTPPPLLPPETNDNSKATPSILTDMPVPILPPTSQNNEEEKKRKEAKRKSSIILVAGTPPKKTPEQLEQETDFKYRGDMNLILGRGKLIDAIVESSLSTDFGGEIRAVITRDVYSEWGKNILIPKGSRVFGNYTTGISGSYGRINVEWTRIDLSSGYSVNIAGSAIDNLGKKGIEGRVDNKFAQRFSNAVLRSVFNVALAKALDSIVKPAVNSQQAATNATNATNIRNIATSIFAQTGKPAATKREEICASVLSTIQDKTSTAFTTISASCDSLRTQTTGTDDDKLTSLMSAINSSADTLLQVNNSKVEESKAQQASKQAFTDISNEVKDMIEEHEFKPTITVNQGTHIKIYVNKDYKFPKAALNKSRVIK